MNKLFAFTVSLSAALVAAQFAVAQPPEENRGPMPPRGDFFAEARDADGRIDLSKLPEQMPQDRKDALKQADKDGDGFLTPEELRDAPRPKFVFKEGERPDFVNENNEFIVEKTIEAIKAADKNNDGIIDADEQKAVADVVREKTPALPRFVAMVLGEIQDRFGGSQGPGFGFQGGPQGEFRPDQPGDRPQRDSRQRNFGQRGQKGRQQAKRSASPEEK